MSILIAAPYTLSLQDLIVVRVSAHNANGWSATSNANSFGATVKTVPAIMTAPVRGSETSEQQIHVTWTALSTAT